MSDNINVTPGIGKTVATDDIAGVQFQRIKLTLGNDGINDGDISSTNPMPVTIGSPSPLPSGAATSANQTTEITSINAINTTLGSPMQNSGGSVTANIGTTGGLALDATLSGLSAKFNSLGQKTMANSAPVVIASDQSAIPVTGSITTSPDVNVHDGSGNAISSTAGSLNVDVTNIVPVSQSGSWTITANAGTNLNTSALSLESTQSAFKSANHTDLLAINTTLGSPFQAGGSIGNTTFASTQSGTWNINNISGTISLPTGASTSANQTTANASLSSIDGKLNSLGQKTMAASVPVVIASDQSPVAVTGTITTSPNVNVHDGSGVSISSTGSSLNVDVTNTVPVSQSGSWTVTANAGTNLNTSALALDTSVNGILRAQGSTTSGETGPLIQGAVTTAAPTYTTGQTNPLSLDTSGNLRITGTVTSTPSGVQHVIIDSGTSTVNQGTSPWVVSGTVTANAGTGTFLVDGSAHTQPISAASLPLPTGAATSANQSTEITALGTINTTLGSPFQAGGSIGNTSFGASQTGTWSVGSTLDKNFGTVGANTLRTAAQIGNATGAADFGAGTTDAQTLRVVLPTDQTAIPVSQSGSWTVTANAGTNLNTSALALDATVSALQVSQGSTTSGEKGTLIMGAVTTAAPSYTTAQTSPLSLDTSGNLRVSGSFTPSGTQNVNVAQINGVTPLMGNGVTGTGSQRVTIASDNTAFTVNAAQSGTWTVGTSNDTNYGTVGANTLRSAAQIGNATGAANFNSGTTGAQTLRTASNLYDSAANGLTSTSFNSKQSLDVRSNNGFSTNSNTRVAVTTASTQLLAANTNRRYAYIFNQSGATLFIQFGAAAVVNQGIRLPNFAMYEINADNLWCGTVNAISSAGTNTLEVFEGTP